MTEGSSPTYFLGSSSAGPAHVISSPSITTVPLGMTVSSTQVRSRAFSIRSILESVSLFNMLNRLKLG